LTVERLNNWGWRERVKERWGDRASFEVCLYIGFVLLQKQYLQNLISMNENALYPDFFARFYDVIYSSLRDEADQRYFMNKILKVNGPVLEVGVGTGRFFTDALNRGADIYGIDISPAMIDVLNRKIPEKEHFRVQLMDICDLKPRQKFKLIVAPFRVFMHFLTIEKQIQALNAMHDLLLPDGILIFDLFVPDLKMLSEGLDNIPDFDGEYEPGKKLKRFTSMHVDPVHQISYITFRLEWDEAGKSKNCIWKTKLRFFFHYELIHLLKRSAFQKFKIFGDFNENPVTSSSREFLVKCNR